MVGYIEENTILCLGLGKIHSLHKERVMIVGFNKKRRNYLKANSRMLTLQEYTKMAERCICHFAPPSMASRMIKDEDAISFVIEHVMYGTCRWNPDRSHRCSLNTYHVKCAIWAIGKWCKMFAKHQKSRPLSLNYEDESGNQFSSTLCDEKCGEPCSGLVAEDHRLQYKKLSRGLTPKQTECINMIYFEGVTQSDAARRLGISRQAISQHVEHAISSMLEASVCA